MKKLHSFIACTLVACLTLVLFSSCEGYSKGYAPKSLVGKTFHLVDIWWPISCETSTTCTQHTDESDFFGPRDIKLTYSYKKTGENTAQFQFWNEDMRSSLMTLRFTSPEEGWATGFGEVNYFILY